MLSLDLLFENESFPMNRLTHLKQLCLLATAWSWSFSWSGAFSGRTGPSPPRHFAEQAARHRRRHIHVAVSASSTGTMQSRKYEVGDKVLTYYEEDCMWYPGQILSINRNGSYLVKWDVPEDGIEEVQVTSEHMRCALIPVRELEIGQKFSGVVFEINSFGAFVDIGAEEHGLLPIGRMATSWFNSTEEVLEEGDSVDVWISRKKDGHFSLTMVKDLIETDLSPFTDLKPDQWVTGVVKSIASFKGAFVTVSIDGISADGFLHVSELSTSFVSSVDQILSKGQEVRVRVLSVDVEAGRMILSLKPHTIKSMNRQAEPDRKHVMHGGAQSRLAALAKITSDQWLQGKVVRVIDIGAFVAVNPGTAPAFSEMGAVDGLLHESQMTGRATRQQVAFATSTSIKDPGTSTEPQRTNIR